MRTASILLLGGFLAYLAPAARADVLVVDSNGVADFADLQSAVDAAIDGDTIVVRRPPVDTSRYAGFVIDGKSVAVVAQEGATVPTGPVAVRNLAAGQTVVLQGLDVYWVRFGIHYIQQHQVGDAIGLELSNNAGAVRVDGCRIQGEQAPYVGGALDGTAALFVHSSADVVVTGSELLGGLGHQQRDGGPGLDATDSTVAIYGVDMTGGLGGPDDMFDFENVAPGKGGGGARVEAGFLYAVESLVGGGEGGYVLYGSNDQPPIGGAGGTGVVVATDARAEALETEVTFGPGGYGGAGYGPDGREVAGALAALPGTARGLEVPAAAGEASNAILRFTGQPGEEVLLLTSRKAASTFLGSSVGFRHVGQPFDRTRVGTVPASGELTFDFLTPDVGAGDGLSLFLQAAFLGTGDRVRMSSPAVLTVLDGGVLPSCGGRVFVDGDAAPGGDGSSWNQAYDDLRVALLSLPDCPEHPSEVWVAEGTYHPAPPNGNRSRSFRAYSGVHVYGGFEGDETALDERDPAAHPVILCGDLNGNDGPDFTDREDNAYHVLTAGTSPFHVTNVRVDGVTIRHGSADGEGFDGYGGGAFLYGSFAFVRTVVHENGARNSGGIRHYGDSLSICSSRFVANYGAERGGAISSSGQDGVRLSVVNSVLAGNTGYFGGGGGVWTHGLESDVEILGTVVYDNDGIFGPGGLNLGTAPARVANSILWKNESLDGGIGQGGQIGGQGEIQLDYSCVQGLDGSLGGVGNVGLDPLFLDALGADGLPGTLDDDLRLAGGSPCIDAGDNGEVPADLFDLDLNGDTAEPLPFDLDAEPRFVDDPAAPDVGVGTPPIVDMGPYEK